MAFEAALSATWEYLRAKTELVLYTGQLATLITEQGEFIALLTRWQLKSMESELECQKPWIISLIVHSKVYLYFLLKAQVPSRKPLVAL